MNVAEQDVLSRIIERLNQIERRLNIQETVEDAGASTPLASAINLSAIGTPAHRTVQRMQDLFHSSGIGTGGELSVSATADAIDVAAGKGWIRATNDASAELLVFEWSAATAISVPDDTTRYIGMEYNAGTPQIVARSANTFDRHDEFFMGVAVNDGTVIHTIDNGYIVGDHASTMIDRMLGVSYIAYDARAGGLALSETGTRNIVLTAGKIWSGLTAVTTPALDTSTAGSFGTYYYNGTDWIESTGTQWPNAQYNDTTSGLVSLSANRYANLYWYIDLEGDLYMLYGQEEHANQVGAEDELLPSSLPPLLADFSLLIARTTFQDGGSAWVETVNYLLTGNQTTGSATPDFIDLSDTPAAYASNAGLVPFVNVGETALEFGDLDDIAAGATNVHFTATDESKLDGIETAADVTDTANVTSAGAVMDSELIATSAGVGDAGKPIKLDAAGHVDATMINDADVNLDNVTEGATNKFFTATEETKLTGIETGAEVNNISDANATDLTDGGATTLHSHSATSDHGGLTGLSDDDHTQYAKLTGRSGGQTLQAETSANGTLTLRGGSSGGTVNIASGTNLQIAGAMYMTGNSFVAPATVGMQFFDDALNEAMHIETGGDVAVDVLKALSASGLRLEDDGGNLGVFVEDGGHVGIGTSSPVQLFDIRTDVTSGDHVLAQMLTDGTYDDSGGKIGFRIGRSFDAPDRLVEFGYGSAAGFGTSPFFYISTGTNSGTLTEKLRVTHDGNVGIGVTSPSASLDVVPSSGVALELGRASGNPNIKSSDAYLIMDSLGTGVGSSALNWYSSDDVILANGGGNVGIGVTSPQGPLHAHDGTGGFIFETKTSIVNSWQTILPNASGDVVYGFYGQYVIRTSGGTSAGVLGPLAPTGTQDVTIGGDTFRFEVQSTGQFRIQRTNASGNAGTCALSGIWL